jgi:hypothetical protein
LAVKRTPTQSYLATVEKFKRMNYSMSQAAEDMRQQAYKDLTEFTSGASPSGKARLKWLRKMGHPYGRSVASVNWTAAGGETAKWRKRGAGRKGKAPQLPIGNISGGLRRSRFAKLENWKGTGRVLIVGFSKQAKGALHVLLPGGTSKMVGRGIFGKTNEGGAIGKRVKQYRKAYKDVFIKENRKP